MIDRFRILGPLAGLIGLAGCAAQPVATAPAAAPADPQPADMRPLPATTAPVPVVPPARSGSGRSPATGSGGSTPTAVVIPGDPTPRTPQQTIVPPPERRPPP
jgi:hypothetical protein